MNFKDFIITKSFLDLLVAGRLSKSDYKNDSKVVSAPARAIRKEILEKHQLQVKTTEISALLKEYSTATDYQSFSIDNKVVNGLRFLDRKIAELTREVIEFEAGGLSAKDN
jgi:transcriptional regulator NrdR family protein